LLNCKFLVVQFLLSSKVPLWKGIRSRKDWLHYVENAASWF